MVWIVFGTKEATRRVPGGARVERHCDTCKEATTFYEKERTSTFRLYFIDVLDYQTSRVMACGGCGTHYATGELSAKDKNLATTLGHKLEEGGRSLERIASSATQELARFASSLAAQDKPRLRVTREEDEAPHAHKAPDRDGVSEDDLAELDETEAKFRRLEEEDRRKKAGRS